MNDALIFRHPKADHESLVLSHELRCIETTFDAGASFALPVPRAMVTARPAQHVPERAGRPMPLAIFGQPPALEGARLLVSTQTLRWEVDPLEWLRWSWAHDGWRIGLAKRHPGPKGPRYELAALREREGRAEVRRTMATRSGARLMRCDAMAPLDVWSQHHDSLWHAIDGFRMGQSTTGTVEALVAHDGPLLGFALPGSWDARGHGGAQRMMWGAQLADDAQRGAVLKVQAQPQDGAPEAQARRDALWRELKNDGVRIGSVLAAERAELAKAVPGWLGQWQTSMEHNGRPGVVVLVQREDAGVVLDYLLMAPAAGTEHLDWMRATRALDVAIATSQPRLNPAA